MYQQFYNFSAEPFRLSPDHRFAYSHKGFNKAWAYMEYAFTRAEGFVMITGKPGTGKTTVIGALTERLSSSEVTIATLVCTQLKADDLLKMVAYEFGISVDVVEKGELLQRLTQQLRRWHRDGRRALLIVDEAQDLSVSAMEELRLLTNIQVDSRPLLQIFLLGQPELRKLILSRGMEQVHQRIIAACHIKPLREDDTEAYIRHRLGRVHWQGDPAISKAVYPLIYKFSGGIPRRINLICSRLLLHCAVEESHQVTVADAREVIEELQSEHLSSGASFTEADFQADDVFDDPAPETAAETDVEPDAESDVEPDAETADDDLPDVRPSIDEATAAPAAEPATVAARTSTANNKGKASRHTRKPVHKKRSGSSWVSVVVVLVAVILTAYAKQVAGLDVTILASQPCHFPAECPVPAKTPPPVRQPVPGFHSPC